MTRDIEIPMCNVSNPGEIGFAIDQPMLSRLSCIPPFEAQFNGPPQQDSTESIVNGLLQQDSSESRLLGPLQLIQLARSSSS
ncbi:hypothetical protein J6590_007840 [Homalodisca vitripennis]|nr:hypothetical protein J6590_007840 [Homalodisca vitripennis]